LIYQIIHYGKAASSQRASEMFIQNYESFYIFMRIFSYKGINSRMDIVFLSL